MALFHSPPAASRSLRALARLLSYPTPDLREKLPALGAVLHEEQALSPGRLAELDALISALARAAPLDAEADYVQLFDGSRSTSLYLFEQVHGDSRDRGPAMIDLAKTYEKAGLFLADGELPDYLPVVLEFTSTQPPRETRAFLAEMAHLLNTLFAALVHRSSAYASVLGALLELAGEKAQPVEPVADEPVDTTWEEPVVFDGCSTRGQARPDASGSTPQPIHIVRKDSPVKGARA